MKKKIMVLFLVVILKASFAQYLVLPDSNVMWHIIQDGGSPGVNYYDLYFTNSLNRDTIINTQNYTKLYSYSGYLGAFKSNTNGKTVFVPRDSTSDFLLYDFSKNKGDTIYNILRLNIWGYYELYNAVVDSVEYITVGPKTLKKMYFASITVNNYWIESVGSVRGFFNRDDIGLSFSALYCMSYNDTTYFPDWRLWNCNLNVDGVYEFDDLQLFNIYPNPFSDITAIEVELSYNTVSPAIIVYNVLGTKIKTYPLNKGYNKLTINAKDYSEGVYLCTIIGNNMVLDKKKMFVVK